MISVCDAESGKDEDLDTFYDQLQNKLDIYDETHHDNHIYGDFNVRVGRQSVRKVIGLYDEELVNGKVFEEFVNLRNLQICKAHNLA